MDSSQPIDWAGGYDEAIEKIDSSCPVKIVDENDNSKIN